MPPPLESESDRIGSDSESDSDATGHRTGRTGGRDSLLVCRTAGLPDSRTPGLDPCNTVEHSLHICALNGLRMSFSNCNRLSTVRRSKKMSHADERLGFWVLGLLDWQGYRREGACVEGC